MGYEGFIKKLAESSLKNGNEKAWHSNQSNNSAIKHFKQGIDSAKGLIFLITEKNEFIDWIKAGRDYVKFSLASTKLNLYLHPCNQIIQEYKEMDTLSNEINKVMKISDPQKIQMIARIGRAEPAYYSYSGMRKELYASPAPIKTATASSALLILFGLRLLMNYAPLV